MIECIFTIDYEIYGNGEGSLRELVYAPTERLMSIFEKQDSRFVSFVEAAELEMIEMHHTDSSINEVRRQITALHRQGFEIGLHLHPQWYHAKHEDGKWLLDYSEYNLCTLSRKRIEEIVQRSIDYLRSTLDTADYTPLAFRAGNWLIQPTKTVASGLAAKGIKIDSSVFKGGLQRNHGLDYRPARKNGYYWRFQEDVNTHDPHGRLIELPTYSVMVPSWKMVTPKRVGMGHRSPSYPLRGLEKFRRYLDFLRFWYPLKLDFCRMTLSELTTMMDKVIQEDQEDPSSFRPVVAIGHTKDLVDFETVEAFLSHLRKKRIPVSTFEDVYQRCRC
jgi:hypothetical protein